VTAHGRAHVWRPGDDPGHRLFARVFNEGITFEGGETLPFVDVAYETWGRLNHNQSNAVLVLHALSGDSHMVGEQSPSHPSAGWWNEMAGSGGPIDTDRYFVVCPNVLGGCQGTTGPGSIATDGRAYGSRFPAITIRDQVAVERALADTLGIARWAAVVGGSMGAMRALEWCMAPGDRVERAVILAVGGAATAEEIGLCELQVRAIQNDGNFNGGDYYDSAQAPSTGMALARGIGQISYRTADELENRFGHEAQDATSPLHGGSYAVSSYLAFHGQRLAARFDPNSYIVLSQAMNHHDLGRARGGLAKALGTVQAAVTVAGIDSDRLYPLHLQRELGRLLNSEPIQVVHSAVGHDGFLVETDAIGRILANALA
jgi:homoserine O-acetyltransferase/O-succinyltransferase